MARQAFSSSLVTYVKLSRRNLRVRVPFALYCFLSSFSVFSFVHVECFCRNLTSLVHESREGWVTLSAEMSLGDNRRLRPLLARTAPVEHGRTGFVSARKDRWPALLLPSGGRGGGGSFGS